MECSTLSNLFRFRNLKTCVKSTHSLLFFNVKRWLIRSSSSSCRRGGRRNKNKDENKKDEYETEGKNGREGGRDAKMEGKRRVLEDWKAEDC